MQRWLIALLVCLWAWRLEADLVKCPECRALVSDKADRCPRCGYPMRSQSAAAESAARVVQEIPKESTQGYIVCVAKPVNEKEVLWVKIFRRAVLDDGSGKAEAGALKYQEVLCHPLDQTAKLTIEVKPGDYLVSIVGEPKGRPRRRESQYLRVAAGQTVPCSFSAE